MPRIILPCENGTLAQYTLSGQASYPRTAAGKFPRIAYAAAHVTIDPLRPVTPGSSAAVDWDATLRFRHFLWDLGFSVAEAMDTAQRGMGLDWPNAKELIERVLREAKGRPGADLACGVGTDQLPAGPASLDAILAAYREQANVVERNGGRMILLASSALAASARGPEDYIKVYETLIDEAADKVILHWLGDMFDPALKGYWGTDNLDAASEHVLALIESGKDKIEGIKISLLDAQREIEIRRRLPAGVKLYTGDDFNYAELIAGDEDGYSHALLGVFDPIAPAAAAALAKLGAGDLAGYHDILAPTVPLSRRIFEAPTQYYKAGVVFLAWLNNHQDHFIMAGGLQSTRGIVHYADVLRLADAAGLIVDPDVAASRMKTLCAVHGIET